MRGDDLVGFTTPAVSVIVPVHNGEGTIETCLRSVFQSSCKELECIVVDDCSTDRSADLAESLGAKVIRLPECRGAAHARNRGAAIAAGEILVFLDADVQIYPETLERTLRRFDEAESVAAIFGSYDDDPGCKNFCSQYKNLFHHFIHQHGREEASTFFSGYGAIRTRVFHDVGGFDTHCRMMEDIQLGYALNTRGYRIRLDKSLQVKHFKYYSFWKLVKSDLEDRAIPWTMLMLRNRRITSDLNLKPRYRASAICAALSTVTLMLTMKWRLSVYLALIFLALGLALSMDVYSFFARKRGVAFAIRVAPLHMFYYLYSLIGFGVGVLKHLWWRFGQRPRVAD